MVIARLQPSWWCADHLAELLLGSDGVCEDDKNAAREYQSLEEQYSKIDGTTIGDGQKLREEFYQNQLLPKARDIKKRFKKYLIDS